MKQKRQDERKPNFIYEFDKKTYSPEEQKLLISRFIQVLSRIESRKKGDCHA